MSPYLLSIDPGDPSGWALWALGRDGFWRLVLFGELPDPDGPTLVTLLGRLLPDCSGCNMVIEDQFYRDPDVEVVGVYGKGRGPRGRGYARKAWRSPQTGKPFEVVLRRRFSGAPSDAVHKIVASRARWEAICSMAGMTLHDPIKPGVWIPRMTKGHPEQNTHKRVRLITLAWAHNAFTRLGYDEAAAILLGRYWIEEQGGRVRSGDLPRLGLRDVPEAQDERYTPPHAEKANDLRGPHRGRPSDELSGPTEPDGTALAADGPADARPSGGGRDAR